MPKYTILLYNGVMESIPPVFLGFCTNYRYTRRGEVLLFYDETP